MTLLLPVTNYIKPAAVSIIVFSQAANRYLILHRSAQHLHGIWEVVWGSVEAGETLTQAAVREVCEETGLMPAALYSTDYIDSYHDLQRDVIAFVPIFLAFVPAQSGVVISPDEHDDYKWVTYEEALTFITFENQKDAIRYVERVFIKHKPNELLRVQFPA